MSISFNDATDVRVSFVNIETVYTPQLFFSKPVFCDVTPAPRVRPPGHASRVRRVRTARRQQKYSSTKAFFGDIVVAGDASDINTGNKDDTSGGSSMGSFSPKR